MMLPSDGQAAQPLLSGAAIALPPGVSGFDTRLAKILGAILPGLPAQDLDSQMFLHDGPEKERFLADPLITHESCPRAPPRRSSPPSKRSRGGCRT
ncbi:alpha/beta hydrolase [Myxococcus xanthus]|uniref:alpha/beta hydrolase n=1 Tax=Myxococcus xanthus TaxID=34 RepID=UPI001CED53AC|nr:alpha/beta hydrolase [Myxococcus xanthus]